MILLTKHKKKCELLKMIESLRREMILIGIQEGLTSENTVKISQKLDIFIAKYQAIE